MARLVYKPLFAWLISLLQTRSIPLSSVPAGSVVFPAPLALCPSHHVDHGVASHEHLCMIDPDHRVLHWWSHNSVSLGVRSHSAAVNPLITIEVRAIERAGKTISSDEMSTYHKVVSDTPCTALRWIPSVSKSQDLPCAAICRRYDNCVRLGPRGLHVPP